MWATIIVTVLSFLLAKKQTGSTGKAAAVAALAGAGTYYATTQTDWFGKDNALTSWPTTTGPATSGGAPVVDADGKPVIVPGGGAVAATPSPGLVGQLIDTTGKTLQTWGGTGTATVVGAGAVASQASKIPGWAIIAGGLGLLFVLAK